MPRFHKKNSRVYMDGYDMSTYASDWNQLAWMAAAVGIPAIGDAVQGQLPNTGDIQIGPLNFLFDNTASLGVHTVFNTLSSRTMSVALGMIAAPAEDGECFAGEFQQIDYKAQGEGMVTASMEFMNDVEGGTTVAARLYSEPWGKIIHAKGAETGVNAGSNDTDFGSQTLKGGYMVSQMFSSNGTATLSIDDSTNDSDWVSLVSGTEQDASSTPKSEMVALATNATVDQYLRWQLALNTATTVTFFISFHRGR